MKEKILAALKAKFTGVNANILNRIAESLAKTVTTEENVATAVEGVTQDYISVIESYGDSRATDAQKTAVQNYEAKYGLKDGEKIAKEGKEVPPEPAPKAQTTKQDGGSETNKLLEQLLEQNKKLTERLDKMDGERTTASRKSQLDKILAKLPEKLRKGYQRIALESLSDDEFTNLTTEITTEVEEINKMQGSKGAVFGRPSTQGGRVANAGGANVQEATDAEATAVVDKLNI